MLKHLDGGTSERYVWISGSSFRIRKLRDQDAGRDWIVANIIASFASPETPLLCDYVV
jgi:hypothetical protein